MSGPIDTTRILTYPTVGPVPDADSVATWLGEQGEPFEVDDSGVLVLRALPVRVVVDDGVRVHVEITPTVPLTRLVLLLAELGAHLRAEIRLAGVGVVERADLWLRFADLQDRLRIVLALARTEGAHVDREDVLRGLWSLLVAVGGKRDLRWDPHRAAIVEVRGVGTPGGLTPSEAAWHDASVGVGDSVAVAIETDMHIVAWRWLHEAWPNLAGD